MMEVKFGKGKTEYGPGVQIDLSGEEVAIAIHAYLVAQKVYISGPRTISVNGDLCEFGKVYVDPSGFVVHDGVHYPCRGIQCPAMGHYGGGKPDGKCPQCKKEW